uniref:Uncharacterized protein n=1 Tax=Peronospora matthiolae TaxID=2874970 RepID=A0AAV1UTW8_9STRA
MQHLRAFHSRLLKVDPDTQKTSIAALTKTYGDDSVLSALDEAKKCDYAKIDLGHWATIGRLWNNSSYLTI